MCHTVYKPLARSGISVRPARCARSPAALGERCARRPKVRAAQARALRAVWIPQGREQGPRRDPGRGLCARAASSVYQVSTRAPGRHHALH